MSEKRIEDREMKIGTFSVVVGTPACDAACPFCISKMTVEKGVRPTVDLINWRDFYKACRTAQIAGIDTVLFTGKGEPLLYPDQISQYLNAMHNLPAHCGFPFIEIQTNGKRLSDGECDKHFQDWYELGLTTFALSIVHWLPEKNEAIYFPGKGHYDLPAMIKRLHEGPYKFRIRLSVMLLNDYISTPDDVAKLIDFTRENSVEQLTIRSIKAPSVVRNDDIANWTREHGLSEAQIKAVYLWLEHNGTRLRTLDYGAYIYSVDGQNVCLSNCLTRNPDADAARQIIFSAPDHLFYDWEHATAAKLL